MQEQLREVFGNANSLGNVGSLQQSVLTRRSVTAHCDEQKTARSRRSRATICNLPIDMPHMEDLKGHVTDLDTSMLTS